MYLGGEWGDQQPAGSSVEGDDGTGCAFETNPSLPEMCGFIEVTVHGGGHWGFTVQASLPCVWHFQANLKDAWLCVAPILGPCPDNHFPAGHRPLAALRRCGAE